MFKSKKTLSNVLGQVNQFISDLKSGIEDHKLEVNEINEEIAILAERKDTLASEIVQAINLIGTLNGNNT